MFIPSCSPDTPWRWRNGHEMANEKTALRGLLVSMFLIGAALFSISPLIMVYSPLPGNLIFAILTSMIILMNFRHIKINRHENLLILFVLMLNLVYAWHWNNLKLALNSAYFIFSIVAVSTLSEKAKHRIIEHTTNVMLLMLAGAVTGFIYAFMGGASTLSLDNVDGRPAELYLFTLTNEAIGNVIRPAGIFDEPGALSFYICLTAAARHIFGLPKRKTWILLLFGFITFSLAHLIYTTLHFLSEKVLSRKMMIGMAITTIALFILVMFDLSVTDQVLKIFNDMLIKRLEFSGGSMAGDNRSHLFMNAIQYLNPSVFFFGIDDMCVIDWVQCQRNYLKFGENPLMPLVQGGITASIAYYLMMAWILQLAFKKKPGLIYLGIFAILLQRPNVISFGYCLLVYFVINLNGTERHLANQTRSF